MRNLLTVLTSCAAIGLCAPQGVFAQDSSTQDSSDLSSTLTAPSNVDAAPWQAIVVGHPGGGLGQQPFEDAFHASRAFENGGIPVIDIIRDLPRARLTDTLGTLTNVPRLIVFYSGRIPSGSIEMQDGTMPLTTILKSAAAGGTREMVLILENCTDASPTPAQVIVPEAPEGMELMVLTSAAFGGLCEPDERLSDELEDMSNEAVLRGPLLDELDDAIVTGAVSTQIMLSDPVTVGSPLLDTGAITFLPDDVILLTPVDDDFTNVAVAPDDDDDLVLNDDLFVEVVLPAREPPLPEEVIQDDGPVITFAALPASQITALPLATGLPEPSIIVGLIEGVTDASLETNPDSEDSNALDYSNLEAVRALRVANPELFAAMLATGAFDPSQEELEVALQTELKRMNCYRMRIDGDWGRGSRRAAQQYFDEGKVDASVGTAATFDLFRTILGNKDVACATPVARASSGSRSGGNRSNSGASSNRGTSSSSAPATSSPTRSTGSASSGTSRSSGGGFSSGNFGGVFR